MADAKKKSILTIKLRIKKAADLAKKEKKNEQKRLEKAKKKAQANNIKRLAIFNTNR